mmetsp:Transcript_42190/g.76110  ORF Transcript_42190/g.76110 Transcript_42190/m.76110 type:complete len:617 (-) Transcript_42190:409-2259(-)
MHKEMQRRRKAREKERRQEEMQRQQNNRERKERQRRQREMVGKARATQSRVVKISDMEHFEKTMLDPSKKVYRTHCLMMFVSNKNAEKKGDEEIYFPYPFAGEAGNDNAYDSMLQIAKVRFNTQTDLTRLFRSKSQRNTPHIIFARKGNAVGNFQTFHPKRQVDVHGEFKEWVESLLDIQATIVNRHSLPVDFVVMRDGHIILDESLIPNYQSSLSLHARDRILAFDKRLDTFPGATRRVNGNIIANANAKGVLLLDAVVTSDNTFTIQPKRCYDLSVQCQAWTLTSRGKKNNQCQLHPEFMHHVCPYTCGVCSEHFASDLSYVVFHLPVHRFPAFLRGAVRSGRYFAEDVRNMCKLRKNAAVAFFVVGHLVPFNILLFQSDARSGSQLKQDGKEQTSNLIMVILDSAILLNAVTICAGMKWMMSTPVGGVPSWLKGFHGDFTGVARHPDVFMILLGMGVIASVYFKALRSCIKNGTMNSDRVVFFIEALLTVICAIVAGLSYRMSSDTMRALEWQTLWKYHKNAAFAVFGVGAFAGVAFLSLKRLSKPLQKKSVLPVILSNLIVLGAVSGMASIDPHFRADLMHVIEWRKNAAFAFVVFGMLTGKVVVTFLCRKS